MSETVRRLLVLAGLSILAGCSASRNAKRPETSTLALTRPGAATAGLDDAEPGVRNRLMRTEPALAAIRFDYDSARLDDGARTTLAENAKWLKEHEDVVIQVAGHCDQRGTDAYNLALGEKRSQAVRAYYRSLGVPGKRVATISFGREKPLCREEGETCWKENRRAETLVAISNAESRLP